MKITHLKAYSIAAILAMGTIQSCQVEEDSTILESDASNSSQLTARASSDVCVRGGRQDEDYKKPVNLGKLDDRTCAANYKEVLVDYRPFGHYEIVANSNHKDISLQPRIERSFPRSNNNPGSYVRFSGVFRILEVGNAPGTDDDGTYIAQAKGKHTGGGGSPDPAICLFLAKPVYGIDKQGRRTQTSFNIYRQQIKFRGAGGKEDRELVFLTNVKKGRMYDFSLRVGFRNVDGKKVHYANATIDNKNYYWNVPQPYRGLESGIRYGAYRVKGGKARIQWTKTKFTLLSI